MSDPLSDFAAVQMAYNRQKGYFRWIVDGQEKFRVNDIGAPTEDRYRVTVYGDGPVRHQAPTQLRCGFGLFSSLDRARPLDQGVDLGAPPDNKPLVALFTVPPGSIPPGVIQPLSPYLDPINVVGGNGPTAGDYIALTGPDFADAASLPANRLFGQGMQAIIEKWQVYVL